MEVKVVFGREKKSLLIVIMIKNIRRVENKLFIVVLVFMDDRIIDFGGVIVDGKYLKNELVKL